MPDSEMTDCKRVPRWIRFGMGLLLLCGIIARPGQAHEGPPFLIITDHDMGPFVVSVWADPDIGTGTFFVVLEPPSKGQSLPDEISVEVGVAPTSGRLDEEVYSGTEQSVQYGARYQAEVKFDRGEMWDVRVTVESAEGGGTATTEVEATPPGDIGPLGMVVYLVPFLAIGFLWLKMVLRKRRQNNSSEEAADPDDSSSDESPQEGTEKQEV